MSGIIKTIKAKDDNNVEQNIFPKTVLEAVVDSETNETLDVILDNLNEKIDNIEPGGGGEVPTDVQEQIDGKVSKSGDTMTGALTVKANVNIPLLSDNSDTTMVTVPTAGTVQLKQGDDTLAEEIVDAVPNYKSFIGSVFEKNVWHNLISARHRNGVSDGANYGMYLKAPLTRDGNLVWNKQHGTDTWSGERTIFDSNNYTNYVKPKLGGIAEQAYDASVWGKAGYIVLAKIVVTGTHMSGANIIFTLSSFGNIKRAESKILLKLSNVSPASSTTVAELVTCNTPSIYYVLTQDTSANTATIEIIASKSAYDEFAITHISTQRFFRDRATVSFPMTFETSLRSGAVAATSYTILDSGNYSNYAVPKTGGDFSGAVNVSSPDYPPMTVTRSGVPYSAAIRFANSNGTLGAIGMSDKGDELLRWSPDEQTISTVLDSGNYSSYVLPLTGGKVTGATQFTGGLTSTTESTILQQDYHCHTFAGGGGSTTGHIKFATIKTNNTYIGGVLKMTIHTRNCVGDLLIGFNGNTTEANVAISYIRQTGNLPQIHIHKSAAQTYDLYIYKMAYESCTVSRIDTSVYMQQRTTITWSDTYASAVPSDATPATKTNDWTTVLTSSGSTVVSLSLNKGSAYILSFLTSTNMSYIISAAPTSTSFIINEIGGGGSATYSVSGTTLTITFSGSASNFSTTCKYIELK